MKKLLVYLTVAAFATISSLQAGDCCSKDKAACSTEAKTACSAKTAAKSSSCSTGKVAKKNVDPSVKGATLLVRR